MKLKSTAWVLAALMCVTAIAGVENKEPPTIRAPDLARIVPHSFGEWTEIHEPVVGPVSNPALPPGADEVVFRKYVNRDGYRINVLVAYASRSTPPRSGLHYASRSTPPRSGLQPLLPEVSYPAQGFKCLDKVGSPACDSPVGALGTPFGDIEVRRLTMSLGERNEPVTYWLVVEDKVLERLYRLMLTDDSPGGLVFRVSSVDRNVVHAFTVQQKFAADMMTAVPPDVRRRLSGLKPAGAT